MNLSSFIQEFFFPLDASSMIGIMLENGEMGLRPLMVCSILKSASHGLLLSLTLYLKVVFMFGFSSEA